MMDARLQQQLGRLESAIRRARLWRRLAWCWGVATVLCILLFVVHRATGWDSSLVWTLPLGLGGLAAVVVWVREQRRRSKRSIRICIRC